MKVNERVSGSPRNERQEFAKRLFQAIIAAGIAIEGATQLARLYNARATRAVSSSAVRKWLTGEAIPKQTHIETLAMWLVCDASWLRYGVKSEAVQRPAAICHDELGLLQDLALLDGGAKKHVYALVEILKQK